MPLSVTECVPDRIMAAIPVEAIIWTVINPAQTLSKLMIASFPIRQQAPGLSKQPKDRHRTIYPLVMSYQPIIIPRAEDFRKTVLK
jgi:hypothetical protein